MAERAIKAGDLVEVMDLANIKAPKKPKFAVGDRLRVKTVYPGGLEFAGKPGIWKAHRFAVRADG